jgi:plastocyanin
MMKVDYLPIVIASLFALWVADGNSSRAGSAVNDRSASSSAVVMGTVKFEGTVPKPAHIDMSTDPQCAHVHPTGASAEDIVTNGKGGLANVIVFISGGLDKGTFDPPQEQAVLTQKGCMYQPHVLVVQANQKLEVVNADATTHNIHPAPNNNREWNKIQPPGVPLEENFAREEIAIPVKCNVHPWMRSYIAVLKHPHFVVTDKNGDFELKNLPPGSYTIEAWHEKLGTATQKITIDASENKTVEFVFKAPQGS